MKRFNSKHIYFFLAAAFIPLFTSCALFDKDKSIMSPVMWSEIDRNRENLNKLRIGMTKEEVKKIMGDPMTDQVYNTDNHWFYYTRTVWSDGMATREECTPVIFNELGLLIGIGNKFYKENCSAEYWSLRAVEEAVK